MSWARAYLSEFLVSVVRKTQLEISIPADLDLYPNSLKSAHTNP